MKKQNHTSHIAPHTSQKGITLIALIITIIVMLILVGVTINVALNGGLFAKAEQAAYQMEASLIREQLEIAKTIEISNNGGNSLEDYSFIKIENLDEIDEKTKNKFKDKIIVNSKGNICYNPETVTNEEEINWLEQIGINQYSEEENNWQKRGLTSDNVIYDKLYVAEDGVATFIVNSDGSFEASWGGGYYSNDELEVCYKNNELVIENGDTIFTKGNGATTTNGAFVFKEQNKLFLYTGGEWSDSNLTDSIVKEENLGLVFSSETN